MPRKSGTHEEKKEKPWEELMDWEAYYKNRGLISTRMGVKKSEYMRSSATPPKSQSEKGGNSSSCCCSSYPVKDRSLYVAKCPGPGQKAKPNRDYMRCFATNMVARKLEMPGWEFECPDRLQIKANVCRGCKLCLDASRINVNCLPAKPLKTFRMEAECLARQLNEGIAIALVYNKKEIGRGCYEVPAAVINRMVNQFEEIVHDGSVELTCRGCTVGLLRLRFSMLMRCPTLKEVAVGRLAGGQERECCATEPPPDTKWLCAMERNVNPPDLSFNVEDVFSSSSFDPCVGFMPSDMDEPSISCPCDEDDNDDGFQNGDCQNQAQQTIGNAGRSQNGVSKQKKPPKTIDMAGPFPNCQTGGCQNLPPRLIDMAGPFPVYACPPAIPCPEMTHRCLDVTIEPPAGPSAQFTTQHRHVLGEGSTNRICQKHSAPKLRQMHISSTRGCVLCGGDVSWLPKVAACPHCGYKAVPDFKERDYDENATAQQILVGHLDNPVEELSFDLGSVEGCSGGDQVAEPASTSEAFETVVRDYKALKRSIRESSMTKACQSVSQKPTQMAVGAEQGAANPQELVKVFAELRDLFKGYTSDEGQKIQDICMEACELAKGKKGKKSRPPSLERKTDAGDCEACEEAKGKMGKQSRLTSPEKKTDAGDCEPCGVAKKKKKRKMKVKPSINSKYYSMYSPGENRIRIRQDSTAVDTKVPAHMGWLWTAHPLASKPGWRPGVIRRPIRDLMNYFLEDFPVDRVPVSKYMSYYNQKKPPPSPPAEKAEDLIQVPTLHIEKKHDEYTITFRPLKDASTLARAANPYADMKPLQFRIVQNPLLKELRDMKRCLKDIGFSKCTCHKPVMHCYCRSFVDKKRLIYHIQKECERRHIDPCEDNLVLSDTSDSEAEFDFGVTPPAGLMHPERLKGKDITHTETQYDEADWTLQSLFPHMPQPEVQYQSCVMGERKGACKWIYGKGIIDEVPKPPKKRNVPKKVKKKKVAPGRVAGGFAGTQYQDSSIYSRINLNNNPLKLRTPEHVTPDYSTDSELPLSGDHMRLLDQAAYPPTDRQHQEPWALEKDKERKRKLTKRRTKKLISFDPSIGPHSSDSYLPG